MGSVLIITPPRLVVVFIVRWKATMCRMTMCTAGLSKIIGKFGEKDRKYGNIFVKMGE